MHRKLIFILVIILFLYGCIAVTKERSIQRENRLTDVVKLENLNRNIAFGLIEEETGWIQMKTLIRTKIGWQIIDRTAMISASESAEGFTGTCGKVEIADNTILYYDFGTVVDDNVDRIVILDEAENETTTNIIISDKGTKIYYYVTALNFGDIRHRAYGANGELLYENRQ